MRRTPPIALLLALLLGTSALANPEGPVTVEGTVTIDPQGPHTTINASDQSIIEWQKFSIGAGETVQFVQPDVAARVLNRVMTENPSMIDGTLTANGIVYIVNPAGVFFGAGSKVDAAQLHAVAGSLSNADFRNKIDQFTGLQGTVENLGEIQAEIVALIGRQVRNGGLIEGGELVVLAAGDDLLVGKQGERIFLNFANAAAPQGEGSVGVETTPDSVTAAEGDVVLGAGDLYALAVRHEGTAFADEIRVDADGAVQIAGGLNAASKIEVEADGDVAMDARIVTLADVSVQSGGTVGLNNELQTGKLDVRAQDDLTVKDRIRSLFEMNLHAGTDGEGTLRFENPDQPVTLNADRITLRAGDGEGGGATNARVDVHNAGFANVSGGASSPRELTIRQDAAISGADLPEAGQLGKGFDSVRLKLQSDDGSVVLDTDAPTVGARLDLELESGNGGVGIHQGTAEQLEVQTLTVLSAGMVDVDAAVKAIDLNLHAGSDGTGDLDVSGARLATSELVLQAGSGDGANANARIATDAVTRVTSLRGDGSPVAVTLRQDADLASDILAPSQVAGGLAGVRYALQSDGGDVTVLDGDHVAGSRLSLTSPRGNVELLDDLSLASLALSAGEDLELSRNLTATESIELQAGSDGDGDLALTGDARLAAQRITLRAGDGQDDESDSGTVEIDEDVRFAIDPATGTFTQRQDATIDSGELASASQFEQGVTGLDYRLQSDDGDIDVDEDASELNGTRLTLTSSARNVGVMQALDVQALDVRAGERVDFDADVNVTGALLAHAATDGTGELHLGSNVALTANELALRAGKGDGTQASARVDLDPTARLASTNVTLRQDAGFDGAPEASAFGPNGPAGVNYTLHSDGGQVLIDDGQAVAGSALTLRSGTAGVRVSDDLTLQSLGVESRGNVVLVGNVRANAIDARAATSGTGTLEVQGVELAADTVALRAGSGTDRSAPGEAAVLPSVVLGAGSAVRGQDGGAPESFTLEQDADIPDAPELALFGGSAPTAYRLQSNRGEVRIQDTARVNGTDLALDGRAGARAEGDLNVHSLDVESNLVVQGDLGVEGELHAARDVLAGGNMEIGGPAQLDGAVDQLIEVGPTGTLVAHSTLTKTGAGSLTLATGASPTPPSGPRLVLNDDVVVEQGSLALQAEASAQGDLTASEGVAIGDTLSLDGSGAQRITAAKGDLSINAPIQKAQGDLALGAGQEVRLAADVTAQQGELRFQDLAFANGANRVRTSQDAAVQGRDVVFETAIVGVADLDVRASGGRVELERDVTLGSEATLALHGTGEPGIVFSSPDAVQTVRAGRILLNPEGRDEARTATVARDGDLHLEAERELRMGGGERLTSTGHLELEAGELAALGDLTALEIDVSAPSIAMIPRAPGAVRRPDGSETQDSGVDVTANRIAFSSTPSGPATFFTPTAGEVSDTLVAEGLLVRTLAPDGSTRLARNDLVRVGDAGLEILDGTGSGLAILDASRQAQVEYGSVRDATPPLVLEEMNVAALGVRPLRAGEVLAFLESGTFERGPGSPLDPDPRLEAESAREALRLYRDLFASRQLDTWTREPSLHVRAPEIRRSVGEAVNAYRTQNPGVTLTGAELARYLSSDADQLQALGYLYRLGDILHHVEQLDLEPGEQDEFADLLVRELAPEGITPDELLDAVRILHASPAPEAPNAHPLSQTN